MAQLVRAPPCHGGGRRFEPVPGRFSFTYMLKEIPIGVLAQLGEHLPYKQRVIGSSPIGPIFMFEMRKNVFMRMHRGVFCVYDEPSTDLCLHKNLYLEENNCFGIICIYGTLTKNERIAMME